MNESAIFQEALLRVAPADRAAYLERACAGDDGLRREVELLLKAHDRAGDFLDRPASPLVLDEPGVREGPGTVIGPYTLREPIGEGGFGVVFLAEQTRPVRRRVALKVLKPGMDTRQVVARFEAERQALALMNHPHIACVFDGGVTPSGRPYFVMELVDGVPLTEFCARHRLAVRERLALFADVCRAVQHAHQKGIIHRDLKPSNVLVARPDGTPVVKVIDFGVAKAVGPGLTEHRLVTGAAQMIGTPLYMSPEQAGAGPDVDTRSDVYSLGVLLYELLTGTTPFERERFRTAGYDEMRRIIREEEPPSPSTRVSTRALAATAGPGAPGEDPVRLGRLLRGELDWVVMRCLAKDRSRRYPTAGALAEDVGRYLADEPVLARPVSWREKATRWVLRRPAAAALAVVSGLAVLALVALGVGLTYSSRLEVAYTGLQAANSQLESVNELLAQTNGRLEEALGQLRDEKGETDRQRARADDLHYAVFVNLADRVRGQGDLATALRMLGPFQTAAGTAWDRRDFEWYYLWRACYGPEPLLLGHTDEITRLAFSPDGRRLASASKDRTIRVWDTATGRVLHTLSGATGAGGRLEWAFTSLSYSPDSRSLAATGSNARESILQFWDVDGRAQASALVPEADLRCVTYSPTGQFTAAGSSRTIYVWDVQIPQALVALPTHGNTNWTLPQDMAFSPDGRTLVSAHDNAVRVWDLQSRAVALTHTEYRRPDNGKLLLGRAGKLLGVCGAEKVQVLRVKGDQPLLTVNAPDTTLAPVASFSPDGRRLLTVARGGTVKVWDIDTGKAVVDSPGWTTNPTALAVSPDGRRLAIASRGPDEVKILPLAAPHEPVVLPTSREVHTVAFSPDGRRLAAPGPGLTVEVWDVAGWTRAFTLTGLKARAIDLAFSPDGCWLAATGSCGGTVWDLNTGRVAFAGPDKDFVTRVAFSPDGRLLAMAGRQKYPQLWEVVTWKEKSLPSDRVIALTAVAFSPDGRHLASAGYGPGLSHDVAVWDVATGRPLLACAGHSARVFSVAYSPDGRLLASASVDRTLKVWDAASGREVATLHGHADEVNGVAFSPGGRRLASGSKDGTIKIWDVATGQELLSLNAHGGSTGRDGAGVFAVAFSPDGRLLASTGIDGTVRVWGGAPAPRELAPQPAAVEP